jgi:RimJ/RimL family protein N-acetyltransferase
MQLHVEALFAHDAEGQLLRVNEPNGAPAPRFFLGTTMHGNVLRFRSDVDPELRRALEATVLEDSDRRGPRVDTPASAAPYEAILARSEPVQKTWLGPAFCFPRGLPPSSSTMRVSEDNEHALQAHLHAWLPDVPLCQPMFAVTIGDEAVAVCGSVRRTRSAHEAGVETAPAYRGRGYAAQAVAAWARVVGHMRLVPLYSTSWQNAASRAVARKLGLICFGSDLHVT